MTRSATREQLGRAVRAQLFRSPRACGGDSGCAHADGVDSRHAGVCLSLPGGDSRLRRASTCQQGRSGRSIRGIQRRAEAPIEASLPFDVLGLDVGYELIRVVDPSMGGMLVERISAWRRQVAAELGIVIPPVHIRDNLELAPGDYRFLLLGANVASGAIRGGRLLAMDATGSAPPIEGEETVDPTFGTPARWILARDRELAEAMGYTVVEAVTIIATHLAEFARSHADQILGRAELQALFDLFSQTNPKLVEDLVPNLLSVGEMLRLMRNWLKEGVSIRDLRTILESLIELGPQTRDPEQLTELVRQELSRQITANFTGQDGSIAALVLDPEVEEMFRRSLAEISQGTSGALDPERPRNLGDKLFGPMERVQNMGLMPCLVTSPDLRRYVRAFAERRCPAPGVLSFREVEPTTHIRPVESISFGATNVGVA